MASFQQVNYCKKCKTNVSLDTNKHCKKCGSTQVSATWSCRFRFVNEEGKEVQKRLSGFKTKKECQDEYNKFMATAKKYVKQDKIQRDLTFEDLYQEYQKYQKLQILDNTYKESSFYSVTSKVKKHILPYFKNYKVISISPKNILDWQNELTKNGYSYQYKCVIRQCLSTILKFGEKYYDIPNKLSIVDNFKRPFEQHEMQIWSPDEFKLFIDKVEGDEFKLFFNALFLTGARKGEILATKWHDWDLENAMLKIDKTFTRKTQGKDHSFATAPKNQYSIREITIPQKLVALILKYKYNHVGNENDRVFTLTESSIDRAKKKACQKAGVKEIRIHDFRHSHASMLIGEGLSIVAVAKRLGHGNIKQTLNTYSHLMPKEQDKISNVLNIIF